MVLFMKNLGAGSAICASIHCCINLTIFLKYTVKKGNHYYRIYFSVKIAFMTRDHKLKGERF